MDDNTINVILNIVSLILIPAVLATIRELRKVHTIVNSEKTARDQWNNTIVNTLKEHGIEVPIDPSLIPDSSPEESAKNAEDGSR